MEPKVCTICHKSEPEVKFRDHYNDCNDCCTKKIRVYRDTHEGYLKMLLLEAEKRARKRQKQGRIEAGICNILFNDIIELWEKQKGLCYYSKLPMVTQKCSDWQASLDRINDNAGYVKGNVVLCCLEFNGPTKWTHEKIQQLFQPHEFDYTQFDFYPPNKQRKQKVSWKIITLPDGQQGYCCHTCGQTRPLTEYNMKRMREGCNICRKLYKQRRNLTPRGHFHLLVEHARSNTKERQSKITIKTRDLTFDIDYDFLVELYRKQKGRCAYSGIPLSFGSYHDHDWIASLERIDPLKGYTKDNVCLIAFEFNTTDVTSMNLKDSGNGSGAWSRDKFNYFREHICTQVPQQMTKIT